MIVQGFTVKVRYVITTFNIVFTYELFDVIHGVQL